MYKTSLFMFTAFFSVSAMSVSIEEKKNRFEYLESLAKKSVSMDIGAYRREFLYEKQNMALEKRAENEANLMAEKIRVQVQKSYEIALENNTPDESYAIVKNAIERDIELIAPELQEEIKNLSYTALNDAQAGGISSRVNMEKLEKALLKGVQQRSKYFNEEGVDYLAPLKMNDADRTEYASKSDLMESLTSERSNTDWVNGANTTIRSNKFTKADARVSMQLKTNYLGVELNAGPTIVFAREYNSQVIINTNGLYPALLPDGNFDFHKRDSNGKIIKVNGKPERRFIAVTCETMMEFKTEYSGGGGFYVQGVGGGSGLLRVYGSHVNFSSRRVRLPEYIDGKSVTMKYLTDLCSNDFLNARLTNSMTVKDSLNFMMQTVVSSLRFSHPKTKCVIDKQCHSWFHNQVIGLAKLKNVPRCVEEKREKFRACELRGLSGQNCTVIENGERISDGNFEVPCDTGLKCVKTQNAGWFRSGSIYQYAKGKCMPVNPRTYKAPVF